MDVAHGNARRIDTGGALVSARFRAHPGVVVGVVTKERLDELCDQVADILGELGDVRDYETSALTVILPRDGIVELANLTDSPISTLDLKGEPFCFLKYRKLEVIEDS